MKGTLVTLLIALLVVSSPTIAKPIESTLRFIDGSTAIISATKSIKGSKDSSRIVVKGDARVKLFPKEKGTSMIAEADTITIVLFTKSADKDAAPEASMVKSVELVGCPSITHAAPKVITDKDTGKKTGEVCVTTHATADKATFDGITGMAYLTGNVVITQDDPSMYATPAKMTGDKASVNLNRAPSTEGFDFTIECNPEATPKP